MVYLSNFVATIKVGGKILRENQNTVAVPFGSEYSIYVKNLNSVRALVRVSIDGDDVTENNWLIVEANGTLELERSIRNGNFNTGNRFKFIERSGQIEEHRGIGAEDGLIRVEYKFETPVQQHTWPGYITYVNNNWPNNGSPFIGHMTSNSYNVQASTTSSCAVNTSSTRSFSKSSLRSAPTKGSLTRSFAAEANFSHETPNDAGITVAGSKSSQRFVQGAWFPTEATSQVIVLKLMGKVGTKAVQEPITVQHKPVCTTCGKVNKAANKFCGRCGTALELF